MDADGLLAECVVNLSEGRDPRTIAAVAASAGPALIDRHTDAEHNRSVLTLAGSLTSVEAAVRAVAVATVDLVDLTHHAGAHPRLGSLDVVPFVALAPRGSGGASAAAVGAVLEARDRFAGWAADRLELPCFLYGPERSLPDVRRTAFRTLEPSTGPARPHATAGAAAVGVRPPLVAYNVWIGPPPTADASAGRSAALAAARAVATGVRGPGVRSLGLAVGPGAQVSLNLIDTAVAPPDLVYDRVVEGVAALGCPVLRAELVGLIPADVLESVPQHRWAELDLAEDRTIEARLGRPEGSGPGR